MNALKNLKVCLFLTLMLAPALGRGEEAFPQDKFNQANKLFEQGNLEQALESYKWLVRQSYESPALYYNFGNLFYRLGNRGKSILWYERAQRLRTRDADIEFNLSLARSHIKTAEDPLLRRALLYFTSTELGWGLTLVSWFFFLLLMLKIMGRLEGDLWPGLSLWSSGLILVLTSGWFVTNIYFSDQPHGIVTSPPGEVRNGPGEDYAVGFTIPDGSKVLILKRRPEWTQVGVPQEGLKGWMPTEEVELIATPPVSQVGRPTP